jgi:hypothetical protein
MKRVVILTEEEWRSLPIRIGQALREQSEKGWGFRVLSRETGQEIVGDDLRNFLIGTIAIFAPNLFPEQQDQ